MFPPPPTPLSPAIRLAPAAPVSFGRTEVSNTTFGSPGGFSMAAFIVLGRSSSHCMGWAPTEGDLGCMRGQQLLLLLTATAMA